MKRPTLSLLTVASVFFIVGGMIAHTLQAGLTAAPKLSPEERKLQELGALKAALDIWLGMDSTEKGGVAWSKRPVKVVATSEVEIKAEAGRKWMDFNEPGALLKFEPALQIGKSYTLCTW